MQYLATSAPEGVTPPNDQASFCNTALMPPAAREPYRGLVVPRAPPSTGSPSVQSALDRVYSCTIPPPEGIARNDIQVRDFVQ